LWRCRLRDINQSEMEWHAVRIWLDVFGQLSGGRKQNWHAVQGHHRSASHVRHASAIGTKSDQVVRPGRSGQHDGAAQNGDPIRAIRQTFNGGAHWEVNFDTVAIMPFAVKLGVGRGSGGNGYRLAVDAHPKVTGSDPSGMTNAQGEGGWAFELQY